MNKIVYFFFVLLLLANHVIANDELDIPLGKTSIKQWNFSLLSGYAVIENPLKSKKNLDTYFLPTWSYYGEKLYIDNTTLGYSIIEEESFLFDIVGYLNDDGALFNTGSDNWSFLDISSFIPSKIPIRPGRTIEYSKIERDFSYMGGLTIQWPNQWLQARLTYGKDISVGHNGEEITLSLFNYYRYKPLNINLSWQVGATYKNKTLIEYYYQFKPKEVGHSFSNSFYKLDSAINVYAHIALTRPVTDSLDLVFSIKKTWLDSILLNTPMVEDSTYLKGVLGINYKF